MNDEVLTEYEMQKIEAVFRAMGSVVVAVSGLSCSDCVALVSLHSIPGYAGVPAQQFHDSSCLYPRGLLTDEQQLIVAMSAEVAAALCVGKGPEATCEALSSDEFHAVVQEAELTPTDEQWVKCGDDAISLVFDLWDEISMFAEEAFHRLEDHEEIEFHLKSEEKPPHLSVVH